MTLHRSPLTRIIAPPLLFIAGIAFWGAFNWSLELTNTETFCISCHEMRTNVYVEYSLSPHFATRTGVRATCPDCHVPRKWVYKVQRKIQATNEFYHWLKGSIDTREKFIAKRGELAEHVWASMKATDSRECRDCHAENFTNRELQSPVAKRMHDLAASWNGTCIDCHKGIAHSLPDDYNAATDMDRVHEEMEKLKIPCQDCHEDMQPAATADW